MFSNSLDGNGGGGVDVVISGVVAVQKVRQRVTWMLFAHVLRMPTATFSDLQNWVAFSSVLLR